MANDDGVDEIHCATTEVRDTTTTVAGRVATDGAIAQRQDAISVEDTATTAAASARRVPADRTVDQSQRAIIEDTTAAYLCCAAADGAAGQRERSLLVLVVDAAAAADADPAVLNRHAGDFGAPCENVKHTVERARVDDGRGLASAGDGEVIGDVQVTGSRSVLVAPWN